MTQDEPVRLLLAEDQVMIREALAALLSFEGDIEVVAQVGRGDEVLKAAEATQPDVAVLDIEMPGMDGLTAAAELKRLRPATKIVILTTFGRPGFLRRAMESGVSAFLVKDSPADKLTQTIRRVLAGERVIDPDLAAAALADGVNPLTPRERDVLEASADGRTSSTCPRARCGITCPHASRRPAPGTAPRPSASPPSGAGSRPSRP
jgi:two-component system, NarL family, response regulator DesR